jgi:hypothetical protein
MDDGDDLAAIAERVDRLIVKHRALRDTLPPREYDPNAMDELRLEYEEWRDSIRRANALILGEP